MHATTKHIKVIISGGGTGGHIFPAIAIADAIRAKMPRAEILFVGAKGKMEMDRVPQAGYPIKGLWISGFQRSLDARNLLFPLKLLSSLISAFGILRSFRPDVVIGVGGYASGPLLEVAVRLKIPALIQEQNSYAGATNRILARKVQKICVAYPDMDRYFPAEKLRLTGNPVRKAVYSHPVPRGEARAFFGLDPEKPTLLVFGGSLGAHSLNTAMAESSARLLQRPDIQVIWQCGQSHYARFRECPAALLPQVCLLPFLERMDMAYAAADVVACRAGALTISELCILGKAAVLVPSPYVAEDHQTKNAEALVIRGAAKMVKNESAGKIMLPVAIELLTDTELRHSLERNIRALAQPDAAEAIADEAIALCNVGN
ncbi:MAG: undecaprenyldiphospho-muramoylpentapeptide beta-N-acetylglucosaminyltransferase [Saprospiraceae bacterium]|jgi:UDP-N-acetylglucosamine--N-acetylmuramyl-(pentapeptide) pyrophosphoryl-undecaprenol N-acetylglucosamine transferase